MASELGFPNSLHIDVGRNMPGSKNIKGKGRTKIHVILMKFKGNHKLLSFNSPEPIGNR